MADQTIEYKSAPQVSKEAEAHNKEISENYKRLLDSALPTRERETAPVRHEINYYPEETAPAAPAFVSVDPSAVNAARLADYIPHPAPAQQGKKMLFEDATYTQGCYTTGPKDSAADSYAPVYGAPVYAPTYADVAAPAANTANTASAEAQESEDLLPTARTMRYHGVKEEMITEPQSGFWAALTTKTKVLIAAVVTVIVVALMIVCINTAVIGNMDADIASKRLELERLRRSSEELGQRIEDATDPATVGEWAEQNGMYR